MQVIRSLETETAVVTLQMKKTSQALTRGSFNTPYL